MSHQHFFDVLENGLRVVTVEAPHLHSATLAVYVKVGSRHEAPEFNGVSHFLEHMFFRGSKRFPNTRKINAHIESVGGNLNGVTTRDHSYYYTPIHPKHVSLGLNVLGDMVLQPLLPHIAVEREIILEEMLDEVDERGRDVDIDNLSKRELFGDHPLSLKIAGTPDSVRRIGKRQLLAHHERYYVAPNLVIAAAGRVHRNEVLDCVQRIFRKLPNGAPARETAPEIRVGPWFASYTHDESQTEFRISFRTVPEHHPDFPVLQLIRRILDDGLSSRLQVEVIEKRGLAYSLQAGIEPFGDAGIFEIDVASAPHKAAKVAERVLQVLGTLTDEDVDTQELRRIQQRHGLMLDFAVDSPTELAGWFGGTTLFRIPETFEEANAKICSVRKRHIRDVAQRYFRQSNMGVVMVGPRAGARALRHVILKGKQLPS